MEKTIEKRIEDVKTTAREQQRECVARDLGTVIVEIANAIRTDTVHETRLALAELGFISSTPRDLMALRAEQQKLERDQRQVQEIS